MGHSEEFGDYSEGSESQWRMLNRAGMCDSTLAVEGEAQGGAAEDQPGAGTGSQGPRLGPD